MTNTQTFSDIAIAEARAWSAKTLWMIIPLRNRDSNEDVIALANIYYPGGMAAIQAVIDNRPKITF